MTLDILKLISLPVLTVLLGILWSLEAVAPLFSLPKNRWQHARRNLTLATIALLVNTSLGFVAMKALLFSEQHQFGLLHLIELPIWIKIMMGFILLDLFNYSWHVVSHHVPFLWRFHQVHHTDTYLDVSSSLRNHPIEGIIHIVVQAVIFPLLGVSYLAYFLYYFISSPWVMFAHANVKLPRWLEGIMSLLFVTPNWHKVHHSANMPETNSHYGSLFSVWDRLFNTAPKVNLQRIIYGLEYFRRDKFQGVKALLLLPFWKPKGGNNN